MPARDRLHGKIGHEEAHVPPDQYLTRRGSETHWERADRAWRVLDAARVPYSVVPGNHDMTSDGVAELYDRTFPVSRHAPQATYGGYLGDPTDGIPVPVDRRNKDSYHLVSWKGLKLLVIALEGTCPSTPSSGPTT